MTRRFVSAKRLIRYFSNSSKLVEHRAQSPVRVVKMLAVWQPQVHELYEIKIAVTVFSRISSFTYTSPSIHNHRSLRNEVLAPEIEFLEQNGVSDPE